MDIFKGSGLVTSFTDLRSNFHGAPKKLLVICVIQVCDGTRRAPPGLLSPFPFWPRPCMRSTRAGKQAAATVQSARVEAGKRYLPCAFSWGRSPVPYSPQHAPPPPPPLPHYTSHLLSPSVLFGCAGCPLLPTNPPLTHGPLRDGIIISLPPSLFPSRSPSYSLASLLGTALRSVTCGCRVAARSRSTASGAGSLGACGGATSCY